MSVETSNPEIRRLHCREIWGGFEAADESVSVPGIEARVISRPYHAAHVGGDIHFLGVCGHGVLSRFIVADVSGHGAQVADIAATLRQLMSEHMDTPDQTDLARAINDRFNSLASGTFATALVVSYLAGDRGLITVNAGHPRPLWYRSTERRWHLLSSVLPESMPGFMNLPLGVVAGTGYYQFAVSLDPDDLVVLYTDSLIEARDHSGCPLGEHGLERIAGRLDPSDVDFANTLIGAVADFTGRRAFEDDVTVVTLHHNSGQWRTD